MQDDYLDFYGNSVVIGENGTDIKRNKCSWIAVMCMAKANEKQKQIMRDCYGSQDEDKIKKVSDLYHELNLSEVYKLFEKEMYDKINRQIQQLSCDTSKHTFYTILNSLYKRDF